MSATPPAADAPLTVGEITGLVKRLLEEGFPDVWVVGEVSNLTRARSGHVYLSLKDPDAVLPAVIWRSTADRLRFELEGGMEVLVRGALNVYPPHGRYQLVVKTVEPRGAGALQQAFETLRRRLEAEGLFDPARKREIPFLPRRIGVVTSPTGAAIRDILKVLDRRFRGVTVLLAPARVQGEGAAREIAAGIGRLSARGDLDVLIVGRGGGSVEDLWAFNEEPVARAIAASAVPVISAVGHEVDVTIADYVADVRAATPSAAAEVAVPSEADLRRTLATLGGRARTSVAGALRERRRRLSGLLGSWGVRRVPDLLRQHAQRIDDLQRRLSAAAAAAVARSREALGEVAARAEALSPLRVLARGYSLTTREGDDRPIARAADLAPGDRIVTRFSEGTARSEVREIEEER
jgi:exodeoxyribonuclease VII large subunit